MKPKTLTSTLGPLVACIILFLAILGCRSTNKPKGPSWTKVTVLSDHEDHPSKIISDGESVFFVTGGTIASKEDGTNNIKRISLKDGGVTVLVHGGNQIPESTLAVDDKFLYWSDGGNLFRVLKQGGPSEKILPNTPQPDEIVMDDENIYWLIWAGEGSPPQPIMFSPKNGAETKQLTPPQPPTSGMVIDRDFVYWMTGSGIRKIPKTGGEITDVYRNPSKQPSLGLAHDTDSFYFCQMNAKGHSALMKLSKQTGQVTQLTPSISHTMDFVLDEGSIYYFDDVPGTGSFGPIALRKVSKNGGEAITLDQGEGGWMKYLAVDSKQVYFTDISKVYAVAK